MTFRPRPAHELEHLGHCVIAEPMEPETTRTSPFFSTVAVGYQRPAFMSGKLPGTVPVGGGRGVQVSPEGPEGL